MNNMMQNVMMQMLKQAPQKMIGQLEQQLKRVNPQAYQEFQQARKSNDDPNAYLNKITSNFNTQQKEQWNNIISMFNQKQS